MVETLLTAGTEPSIVQSQMKKNTSKPEMVKKKGINNSFEMICPSLMYCTYVMPGTNPSRLPPLREDHSKKKNIICQHPWLFISAHCKQIIRKSRHPAA